MQTGCQLPTVVAIHIMLLVLEMWVELCVTG